MFLFCAYFFTYAFVGWCVEVAYAACKQKRFVNRGFLNGALCPIYGFGVAGLHMILTPFASAPLPLLFLISVVVTSALEWLTGFLLDRIFHHKWWDYTGRLGSVGGYICLKFSLIWGAACCLVVRFVFPLQDKLLARVPRPIGWPLLGILIILIAADVAATVCTIVGWNRQMTRVEAIAKHLRQNSDKFGTQLSRGVLVLWERHLARAEKEGIFRRRLRKAFTEKPFLRKAIDIQAVRRLLSKRSDKQSPEDEDALAPKNDLAEQETLHDASTISNEPQGEAIEENAEASEGKE